MDNRMIRATKILFTFLFISMSSHANDGVITVDLNKVEQGKCITVRLDSNTPEYIVCKRTPEQIRYLTSVSKEKLADYRDINILKSMQDFQAPYGIELANRLFYFSQIIHPDLRSIKNEYFVAYKSGVLGCSLLDVDTDTKRMTWGNILDGENYFQDPCTGNNYDLAGRIYKNNNLSNKWNLRIPLYSISDNKIIIGKSGNLSINKQYDFSPVSSSSVNTNEDRLALAIRWDDYELAKQLVKELRTLDYVVANTSHSLIAYTTLIAMYGNREKYIELLLKNGANPDYQPKNSQNALYFAVDYNLTKVVEILLKAGANPSSQIVELAKSEGNTEIIKLIEIFGVR